MRHPNDHYWVRTGKVMQEWFRHVTDSKAKPGSIMEFASINKAKQHSRELQKAHGGLGAGFVRVTK